LKVVALRDVSVGEEITISYLEDDQSSCCGDDDSHHLCESEQDDVCMESHVPKTSSSDAVDEDEDLETRRDILRKYYLFECTCKKCSADDMDHTIGQ
jgi:hypothetical protein